VTQLAGDRIDLELRVIDHLHADLRELRPDDE